MTNSTVQRRRRRHHVPDQSALLVLATRRGPATPCAPGDDELTTVVIPGDGPAVAYTIPQPPAALAAVTERSHLSDRDTRVIRFDDLPPEDPDLLTADPPRTAEAEQLRGVDPQPLRPGHMHADQVLAEMDEELNEHVVHHQVPKTWLRTVSPLSALDVDQRIAVLDDAALDVEIELAYLAAAISDLAACVDEAWRPVGRKALAALFTTRVSTWDHRPLNAAVGRELNSAVGHELPDVKPTIALDDLPSWIQTDLQEPHGTFRAGIHRHAAGAHLTTITPDVAVDRTTGLPVHLCHRCDLFLYRRTDHPAWVSASAVTILTLNLAVAA